MSTTHKDYDPDALRASIVMVGIDYAAPSPTNPRKTFNETEMAELTESIKKHGVLQPIIVRQWPLAYPSPGPLVTYEIIAGERRWRAVKAAGLTMLEAKLRDLTDLEVLEIQIIENLQRADLHPLEEAEGYERIMNTHAYTADQLADKIGKSRSYIFARLKLLALDDDARRLFRAGLLNPSTALLVARIPSAKLRLKAIEDITTPHYGNEPMSVRQAHERIRNRYMTKLDDAPFSRVNATLIPTAGSCLDCPHRTGNAPDLFDDIDSPDVCTDPDCFVAKKIAHRDREAEKAQAAGSMVILGDEAKKIAPNGTESYNTLRGYTKLDAKCYEDPTHRTYAEIIGDTGDQVLLEDTYKNTLVAVLPNKIIAEKLQAAGVKLRDTERAKADEKVKAKLDLERATRQRMFDMVRENVSRMVDEDGAGMAYYAQERIFNHIAQRMWERFGYETKPLIANLWGAVGKTNTDRAEAFGLGIPSLSTPDCWKLMVDMLLVTSTTVASEWDLENGGKQLSTIAELFDINQGEVKKLVQEEKKEQKPATKGKKSAKNTPTATEKKAPPPLKAAQAAGLESAEKKTAQTEAALDELSRISQNLGGYVESEEEQSSAANAAVEKTSNIKAEFAVGDAVRVIDAGINLGKVGVIDCIYTDGRTYPFALLIDGYEFSFSASELESVEKAIETDENPSPTNRPSPEYQHPENSDLVWSGRGRKPKWVESWLATTGQPLDALRLDASQQHSSAPTGANAKPSMAEAVERCTKTLELPID
jgi:ParB/RepB/Spo0J family partition protein